MTMIQIRPKSPYLKQFRNRLRHNLTPAEVAVAEKLRKLGFKRFKFAKQQCFLHKESSKCYIVDFWLWEHRLVIECDGSQHYTPEGLRDDGLRDGRFLSDGIKTLRLPNDKCLSISNGELSELIGSPRR